jgi:hypothetical protein
MEYDFDALEKKIILILLGGIEICMVSPVP